MFNNSFMSLNSRAYNFNRKSRISNTVYVNILTSYT